MEAQMISRQQRRFQMRQQEKADARQAKKPRRQRPRRPRRIDLLAHLFPVAEAMLMSSDTATPPKFRAIAKTARYLIASPHHRLVMRHQRGGWRTWPQRIGAIELAKLNAEK